MLKPDKDRHNYSDLLIPPVGYEIDFAIGTTYSLDLEALIGVPLALSLSEEMEKTFLDNTIYALEALRRSADKFAIFCEAGQIKVPKKLNNTFALLENSVFEIALDNDHSFHPKVWVNKYINEDKEAIYRLIVLSRNLTFDRSWDLSVALEGKIQSKKTTKNKPLIDFLQFLVPYSDSLEKQEEIKTIISELKYVHFDSMDKSFPEFEFYPLGINGYEKENIDLFDKYHDLIIMSPFLSKSIISKLNNRSLKDPKKVLITRKSELHKLTDELISDIDVYTLRDAVIDGEGMISGENEDDEVSQLQDIHAKFYAKSRYTKHSFYIGSANSSYKAFNGNVEFLLKLDYKKRGFRLSDLLEDLFGEDEGESPFEKIETIPLEKIDPEEDLRNLLQKEIKKLCRINSQAIISKTTNEYTLQVSFDEIPFDKVPSDIKFRLGPLLSKHTELLTKHTIFEDLSLLELGEFYKVTAEKDCQKVERIIKIETKGIPKERENAIFRSIIKDPHTFLMYVSFLLADDFLLSLLENWEKKNLTTDVWNPSLEDVPILYENLLKATSRSPEKLQDIEEIIKLIDDDKIIPPEFDHLYQTFLDAARKVKK